MPSACQSSVPFLTSDPTVRVLKGSAALQRPDGTPYLDTGAVYSPRIGLAVDFLSGGHANASRLPPSSDWAEVIYVYPLT